jgi:tetratricopeptide (TPR) repeat protein
MDKAAYEKQLVFLAQSFKYEELLELASQLVQDYPDWHIAWHYLAVAHGLKGNHEGAVENFINALKHKPSSTKALYGLSVSCHALKMYDKAIACLLKYRTINKPGFKDSFCLGINYAELGDHAEAVKYFSEALSFEGDNEGLLFCLADSYRILGQFKDAVTYFEKSLSLNPHNVNVLHNTAVSYAGMNDKSQAIVYYQKAIQCDEKFTRSIRNLAELYIENGDKSAAKPLIMNLQKLDPESDYVSQLAQYIV